MLYIEDSSSSPLNRVPQRPLRDAILRDHRGLRGLRAMISFLGHKADQVANQPSGITLAQFAVRASEEQGRLHAEH